MAGNEMETVGTAKVSVGVGVTVSVGGRVKVAVGETVGGRGVGLVVSVAVGNDVAVSVGGKGVLVGAEVSVGGIGVGSGVCVLQPARIKLTMVNAIISNRWSKFRFIVSFQFIVY